MKWMVSAADSLQDWLHIDVDGTAYCVHKTDAEIHGEANDGTGLDLFYRNEKHRRNLVEKAALAQREDGQKWSEDKPGKWAVHCGNKDYSVNWDGTFASGKGTSAAKAAPGAQEWISSKIKKLVGEGKDPEQAAAIAYDMARNKGYRVPRKSSLVTAESIEEISRRKFNKDYTALSDAEKAQLLEELRTMPPGSTAPAPPTAPAPYAPLAPGQGSIKWFVSADDKQEDDGDDEDNSHGDEKDDSPEDGSKQPGGKPPSKAPPFKKGPHRSQKQDSGKDEKKDVADAKKAAEILRKLLDKELSEGEPHAEDLKKALEMLEKFLKEEASEGPDVGGPPAMPKGPGMVLDGPSVMLPSRTPPGAKKTPLGPPAKPLGASEWLSQDTFRFKVGQGVWRKSDLGGDGAIGLEPGRVVSVGDKVAVDWGDIDMILSEEDPLELVLAEDSPDPAALFSAPGRTNLVMDDADEPLDQKAEIEAVLASVSLKSLLERKSLTGSNPNAIEHSGTGIVGERIATATDGRVLVSIDGKESFVWPYEIRSVNIGASEV